MSAGRCQWQERNLSNQPLTREGGYLLLPDRTGIGIGLNEEAFSKFPPVPHNRPALINPDGSLRDYKGC